LIAGYEPAAWGDCGPCDAARRPTAGSNRELYSERVAHTLRQRGTLPLPHEDNRQPSPIALSDG
jgi:hypothetical protein